MAKNNGTKITIKVSKDDMRLSEDFFEYEEFKLFEHEFLERLIQKTLSKYQGNLEDPEIRIKIDYQWQ